MNVNFNGMRRNATARMNDLRYKITELLQMTIDGRYFEIEDFENLVNSFNNSAGAVDVLNCLYDNSVEDDMDDLSELINIDCIEFDEYIENEEY